MERQQLWALYHRKSQGCSATSSYNQIIGCLSRQKQLRRYRYKVLTMCINGASTTLGLVSRKILWLCGDLKSQSDYRLPFKSTTVATISLLCPKNEHHRNVNNFGPCITENPSAVRQYYVMIRLSAAFLAKNSSDDIATMSSQ